MGPSLHSDTCASFSVLFVIAFLFPHVDVLLPSLHLPQARPVENNGHKHENKENDTADKVNEVRL